MSNNEKPANEETISGCLTLVVAAIIVLVVLYALLSIAVTTEQIEIEYKYVEQSDSYVLYRQEDSIDSDRSKLDFEYWLCVEPGDTVKATIDWLGNIEYLECPKRGE